jgi:putative colanic acid biosynthesis acetyltransferase WcaB
MNRIMDNEQKNYGIFQDWKANASNLTGRFIMVSFRIAQWTRSKPLLTVFFFWYLILYKISVEWISSIQISLKASIGSGLRLENGRGTVIDSGVVFGINCTLRHLTTISSKKLIDNTFSSSPKIGDNVDIGVNAIIIGQIQVGNNIIIGAGAVVTKNVSDNSVMVGNPAKLLKKVYDYPSFEDHEKKIADIDAPVTLLDKV